MRPFMPALQGVAIVLACGLVQAATAGEFPSVMPPGDAASHTAPPVVTAHATAPPAVEPQEIEGMGMPIGSELLEALRGGDSTTNEVDIRGRVDNNTATGIVSGTNSIHDGAFANSTGFSTVIQNSGSNVLIQNGTVINVQFVDPGR